MWNVAYTIVAGADLSGQQYKFINALGTLAGSPASPFGINQSKASSGDHVPVVKFGHSLLYMSAACSKGDYVGQSAATSGAGVIVASGDMFFAQVLTGTSSGGYARVACFGAPIPVVK